MVYELTQDSAMSTSAVFNTLALSKVKWNAKHNKLLLQDKSHAVIAIPGFEFMSAGQEKKEEYYNTGYLGATASKFLMTGGGLMSENYSMR